MPFKIKVLVIIDVSFVHAECFFRFLGGRESFLTILGLDDGS